MAFSLGAVAANNDANMDPFRIATLTQVNKCEVANACPAFRVHDRLPTVAV
jgi:hypothetical protein